MGLKLSGTGRYAKTQMEEFNRTGIAYLFAHRPSEYQKRQYRRLRRRMRLAGIKIEKTGVHAKPPIDEAG